MLNNQNKKDSLDLSEYYPKSDTKPNLKDKLDFLTH